MVICSTGHSSLSCSEFEVRVEPADITFGAKQGQRLLEAARHAGVELPYECGWGTCGTCKVSLVDGTVENLYPSAPAIKDRDARRNRILTCQSAPTSNVTLRVTNAPETASLCGIKNTVAEVISSERFAHATYRVVMKARDAIDYYAGQYAIITFPSGIRRCYSMATPAQGKRLEFIFKNFQTDAGSTEFAKMPVGGKLELELPYGEMRLPAEDAPILLIAGGTGISAMRALTLSAVERRHAKPVRLLFGARSPDDLIDHALLSDKLGSLPDGDLLTTVDVAPTSWQAPKGPVTILLDQVLDERDDWSCCVAGPPVMVDATLQALKDRGISMNRVQFDRFG